MHGFCSVPSYDNQNAGMKSVRLKGFQIFPTLLAVCFSNVLAFASPQHTLAVQVFAGLSHTNGRGLSLPQQQHR